MNPSGYNTGKDYFIIAALVCSALSLSSTCMAFPALVFGSLGILFALLSKRRYGHFTHEAKFSIAFCTLGLILGVVIFISVLPDVWRTLTSGEFSSWMSQLNDAMNTVSGNSVSGAAP